MSTETLRSLIDASGVRAAVSRDAAVTGITHVSAEVRPGDLFCCIPGAAFDGHDFAGEAVRAGASALLVQRDLAVDVAQARVQSVRAAVGPIASAFYGRPSQALRLVGVTGTNGKTTTTYLIESIARAAGARAGVMGTIEYRLGVRHLPKRGINTAEGIELHRLLATMRDEGADVVALEVTSEGLDKGRVDGTRFACAVFTNLTQDHLNYHGTMEAYFEAKAKLFDPRVTAAAVVNVDNPWGRTLAGRVRDAWTSSSRGAAATLAATAVDVRVDGLRATLRTPSGDVAVESPLVGRYNIDNILCAAGAALRIGLPLEAVHPGVASLECVPGRLERIEAGQEFTVLVDYAHTPDALEHALGAARGLAQGARVLAVFGCGGDRDRGKRPQMGKIAARLADLTVVTSDNPRSEDPLAIIEEIRAGCEAGGGAYVLMPDRRDAIAHAVSNAHPGDVVLIAGKGHEQGQTFADRTVPFDDRSVAREVLACRS